MLKWGQQNNFHLVLSDTKGSEYYRTAYSMAQCAQTVNQLKKRFNIVI